MQPDADIDNCPGRNSGSGEAIPWIVSRGIPSQWNGQAHLGLRPQGAVTEYPLSTLGYYLVSPHPVRIQRQLIGCELTFKDNSGGGLRRLLHRMAPRWVRTPAERERTLVSDMAGSRFRGDIQDVQLAAHMERLEQQLLSHDRVVGRLDRIDVERLADIAGLCRDSGDNRSRIALRGDLPDKIQYVLDNLLHDVDVILSRACAADGLFELEGDHLSGCDFARQYRLMCFSTEDDGYQACVLKEDGSVDFSVQPASLSVDLHLLQQAISTNPAMGDALARCVRGEARAVKLFINRHRHIDYSRNNLPDLYEKVFLRHKTTRDERTAVKRMLNEQQLSISFNFIPLTPEGPRRVATSISVLHDVRALEPIREHLPHLYREIRDRAAVTDAGRFYLLETMKGYLNVG